MGIICRTGDSSSGSPLLGIIWTHAYQISLAASSVEAPSIWNSLPAIGVIYRGKRGTPLFRLRDNVPPLFFQDEKVKNLRSPAYNRGDLRRLNYNKTAGELMTLSQTSESDGEGFTSSYSPPVVSGPKGASFFF